MMNKDKNNKLTESEILQIRSKIESIDGKLDLLLGGNQQIQEHVFQMFRGKKRLAEIYLALDNSDDYSQTTTLEYLANLFKSSKQNIGQVLKPLRQSGIIEEIDLPNGMILCKKNSCERVFGISKFLKKEFGLESQRRVAEPDPPVSDLPQIPQ